KSKPKKSKKLNKMRLRSRTNSSTGNRKNIVRLSMTSSSNNNNNSYAGGATASGDTIRTPRLTLHPVAVTGSGVSGDNGDGNGNGNNELQLQLQQQLEQPHAPPAHLLVRAQYHLRWAIAINTDTKHHKQTITDDNNSNIVGFVDLVIPSTLPSSPLASAPSSPQPPTSPATKYYNLWRQHRDHHNTNPNLNLTHANQPPLLASRIMPAHCGNGYSTEAVKAVLLHVFKNGTPAAKRLSRVHAAFEDSNPVRADAAKILERLGFSVADRATPSLTRDGKHVDGWTLYECRREQFLESWTCD
ncbi:hypothetical protein HK100_007308, partial [Physocladia obscura]